MNIKDIPVIIPNFNQLTYLRNLINQIRWYYPENSIQVVDNGSTYEPLLEFYEQAPLWLHVFKYNQNDFVANLNDHLKGHPAEYYVITDPDLSIPPTTPPNFLEVFKTAIDAYGFHHAGFGLRVDDLPSWNPKAGWIAGDEKALLKSPVVITHEGKEYQGFRAPIDTTFAMYKRDNGGWSAPMPPNAWDNSVRLFELIHSPWYLHKDYLNEEMKHYFATCLKRDDTKPSAGRNHYSV